MTGFELAVPTSRDAIHPGRRAKWSGIRPGTPNPPILGRKICGGCGQWRPLADYRRQTAKRPGLTYCEHCIRAISARRWRTQTPQQRDARREWDRFYRDQQRRQAGVAQRAYSQPRRSVVDRVERVLLPREPLLEAIEYYARAHTRGRKFNWEKFAAQVNCSQRAIYRIRTGESARVRIDVADRIAYGMGIPLSLIYQAGELE